MNETTDLHAELTELRAKVKRLETENQKLRASNRRWMRIAGTDSLTGLPNRVFLTTAVLPQLISKSSAEGVPVSCLILAPDQLADINRDHGREGGDTVIRALGEFLAEHQDDGERLIHLDGANFVLVLPGADATAARRRARILRARLASRLIPVGDQALHLTLSIGSVTHGPGSAETPADVKDAVERMLRRLTATLDKAKRSGRDKIVEESELDA